LKIEDFRKEFEMRRNIMKNNQKSIVNHQLSIVNFKGFTLIEMMVVIAIIVIIMGFIFIVSGELRRKMEKHRADVLIKALCVAIERYEQEQGFLPDPDNLDNGDGSKQLYRALNHKSQLGSKYHLFSDREIYTIDGPPFQIKSPWNTRVKYDRTPAFMLKKRYTVECSDKQNTEAAAN
jgi:prepilin-type N-terminal cleavage/methylation domain-containing protein